jgi:hypothetical protein
MAGVKRQKVGHSTGKKQHAPQSSPPPAPSSEPEASDDEQESATVDEADVSEADARPKTFKELVRLFDAL